MKKLLPLTLLAVMIGGVAHANGHGPAHKDQNPCMKPGKVLTKDVELTEDQRALAADLKAQKKEHREGRHEMKRAMMQQRIETLTGYANGTLSRRDVNAQIERHHAEMMERHGDMKDGLLALIDSYDEAQKDQVRSNLEESRECMAENQEQFQAHKAEKEAHMAKRAEKKAALLTRDLNLSADQQTLFDVWQEGQQDLRQDRMERHMSHKGQRLEALLDGQTFERDDQAAEHIEAMKTQAGLMMDFVDALDNDQRAQLVSNVEAMAERAAERAEKGHKGNRKGKPQR
jgi:hypothetical protein